MLDRIGRGASGEVWRAHDRRTGDAVAAKLLWPQHASDPEILARFVQERSVLLGLDHPQVVRVRDFVAEGRDLAIVMDLVEGPSLARLLRERRTLPSATAVPLAAAVLDALDAAHRRGVVHRDVKPDNVLLARAGSLAADDVRLADFGIAGIVQDEAAPGTELVGTPAYMPPELVAYGKFGPASDVYAVGVLLYELLAGRTPFAGEGTHVTLGMRQVEDAPPPLPVAQPLLRVLERLLSKDPAARPDAAEAAHALRCLDDASLATRELPEQTAPASWSRSASVLPAKHAVEQALRAPRPADPGSGTIAPDEGTADLEATSLRAAGPSRPVRHVEDVPEQEPLDGSTMMRAVAPDPRLVPRGVPSSRRSASQRVLIALGAVLLLGGGGAALWASGVLDRDAVEPEVQVTTAAAHRSGSHLPTGLRMDLDASWDAADRVTRLRVSLSAAPHAPLRGDVLVVTPASDGGCAEVVEQEGVVRPVRASSDGVDLACGQRLLDVDLPAGSTTVVDLAVDLVPVDAEGVAAADYGPWLESVRQATDAALPGLPGTAFALQRVSGVRAEPDGVTLTGAATAVPYRVIALWAGGETGETELFTQDTVDGMETELLRQLTGGAGLDGVAVSSCNAAQVLGIRVLAEQPDSSCHVRAVVGALDSGEAPFAIRMR
nr:serine/threonine-protein kinase [Cellulomonas sp. IC4_254]